MLEKALELLKIFNVNGYEAYLVGGFVRDHLLGRKSSDIDICTNATPMEVKEIFKDVNLPSEGYGAVNFNYKKVLFEITTYRMDLEYNDKRVPSKIMYTDKLEIDLKRRDFIMNTLCMDKYGNIIDLLGATSDIKNKIIRCVGNADKRFKEDPLRILRAIRFSTELNFKLDDELKRAISNNKELLKNLSYFRKKQELNKIFSSANSLAGINILKEYNLDKYLDINLSNEIVNTNDPIGIWAQVSFSDKYPFTALEKGYLNSITRLLKDKKISDIKLYQEGNYVCYIAAQILRLDEVNIYDRYDSLPIKSKKDISLSAKEIIDILNLEDKSKVKLILNDIEEKIIYKKIINDKDIITKYVIETYKNNML